MSSSFTYHAFDDTPITTPFSSSTFPAGPSSTSSMQPFPSSSSVGWASPPSHSSRSSPPRSIRVGIPGSANSPTSSTSSIRSTSRRPKCPSPPLPLIPVPNSILRSPSPLKIDFSLPLVFLDPKGRKQFQLSENVALQLAFKTPVQTITIILQPEGRLPLPWRLPISSKFGPDNLTVYSLLDAVHGALREPVSKEEYNSYIQGIPAKHQGWAEKDFRAAYEKRRKRQGATTPKRIDFIGGKTRFAGLDCSENIWVLKLTSH